MGIRDNLDVRQLPQIMKLYLNNCKIILLIYRPLFLAFSLHAKETIFLIYLPACNFVCRIEQIN